MAPIPPLRNLPFGTSWPTASFRCCGRSHCSIRPPAPPPPETLAVLGAGQMGRGIALAAAHLAGIETSLYDPHPEALRAAEAWIRARSGGALPQRLILTSDLRSSVLASTCVLEAIPESLAMKSALFGEVAGLLPIATRPGVVFASNTSSISVTALAAATDRPARCVGMHFMNPPHAMSLVEVVPGLQTSEETVQRVTAIVRAMDKTPVVLKDTPGFVVNRLLVPYINDAIATVDRGVSAADVDRAMKLGANMPMGPLALADFVGLDTCLAIMDNLHAALGEARYAASPLLRRHVDAGWLGVKSGRGFFEYRAAAKR